MRDIYSYNLSLNVSASDSESSVSAYWYSLNGGANVTFVPNTTIKGVAGQNTLVVYANDSSNNIGSASARFNLTFTPKIDDVNVSNLTVSYAREDVTDGLVLYWRLDKNHSIQEDSVNGLYNGSVDGARFTHNGRVGGAYEFNAIDPNEIYKTNTYLFNFQNPEFSYSAWINVKELTNTSGYPGFNIGVMGYRYSSAFDIIGTSGSSQGTLRFGLRNNTDASNAVVSNTNFFSRFNNTWVFIAGTYDPSTCDIRIYINGQNANNKTFCIYNLRNGTDGSSYDDFGIGEPVQGGNIARLNGSLDEVRVYNRSLSADEVRRLYSITNPTFQEAANVTINVTVTDEDTPRQGLFFRWLVDGVQVLAGFAKNVFNYIFTRPSSVVTLMVNDSNNNTVTQSWNISTNLVNPTINFTAPTPSNGSYLAVNNFVVNFTGIEPNRQAGWVTMNGVNYTAVCIGTSPYYCSYSFSSLADGTYLYKAYVNDSLGNQNSTEQRAITVDGTYPVITYGVGTESDGAVVDRGWIYVNVSAQEINEEKIVFNLYNGSVPKNDLVLWLALDENKENLIDGSLYGNDAIRINQPIFNPSGRLNGAYSFDGINDYLQVNDSDTLDMHNETSISVWFKPNSVINPRVTLVGKHYLEYELDANPSGCIHTYTSNGAGGYDEGINVCIDGYLPSGETDWLVDKWYHVVWTLNKSVEKVWVNGVFLGNYTKAHVGITPGTHPLEVGRRGNPSPSLYFNGTIDELRIYNRSISQEEVTALYNSMIVNSSTFTDKRRTINWTNLDKGDYYYNVYISDLAGNQDITETRSINLESQFLNDTIKFSVKNSSGDEVAWFGDRGNIVLKGTCTNQTTCTPPANSFKIQNSGGETFAYIDSEGNMCIESGDCSDESMSCSAPSGALKVTNSTGSTVSYISLTGDLCLIGRLYEHAL